MIPTRLENICIPDTEKFLEYLNNHLVNDFDIERFKDDFSAGRIPMHYFNNLFEKTSEKNAAYLWIQLPVLSLKGNHLFISMKRGYNEFHGDLVGELPFLVHLITKGYDGKVQEQVAANLTRFEDYIEQREDNPDIPETFSEEDVSSAKIDPESSAKLYVSNDLVREIKETLLIDNWETMEGFRRLLLVTGARANHYVKNNECDFYIINNIKSIVVNTGLLNKYGQCIKVMYRWHAKAENYLPYKLMDSKTAYIENDFTIEDANKDLKPIVFMDESSSPFSTDINRYDNSSKSLKHCTDSARRDRFPESVKDISDLYLTQKNPAGT